MTRLALVALALAACTPGRGDTGQTTEQPPATMPDGAIVLTGAAGRELFQQCSRGAPEPGPGEWPVDAATVQAIERALPAAMPAMLQKVRPKGANGPPPFTVHAEERAALLRAPAGFFRQYVGFLQDGRRLVYGNFYPRDLSAGEPRVAARNSGVCDGGPRFFGLVYDAVTGRVTDMDFNGGF